MVMDVERGNGGSKRRRGSSAVAAAAVDDGPFYCESQEERVWTSWLVPMLVVANVAAFVAAMGVNNCPSRRTPCLLASSLRRFSFQPLRENPLFGPSASTLQKLGALEWDRVVHGHQAWRLVTCIWLHAGVIHIVANMLSLLFVGIRLEQQFGFIRIGIIYLLSGFGGSVLSSLFIRNNISVGASGALFGLLGTILSELFTNWTIYTNKAAALSTLLVIVMINLAVGILPHVDNFAHIGGFLTGFLLGFVFLIRPQFGWVERHSLPPTSQVKFKHKTYQYILLVIALMLLIAGYLVGLICYSVVRMGTIDVTGVTTSVVCPRQDGNVEAADIILSPTIPKRKKTEEMLRRSCKHSAYYETHCCSIFIHLYKVAK